MGLVRGYVRRGCRKHVADNKRRWLGNTLILANIRDVAKMTKATTIDHIGSGWADYEGGWKASWKVSHYASNNALVGVTNYASLMLYQILWLPFIVTPTSTILLGTRPRDDLIPTSALLLSSKPDHMHCSRYYSGNQRIFTNMWECWPLHRAQPPWTSLLTCPERSLLVFYSLQNTSK